MRALAISGRGRRAYSSTSGDSKSENGYRFFTFRPQDFNFEGIVTIAQCSNMWYLSHIGVYDYHAPSQLGLK